MQQCRVGAVSAVRRRTPCRGASRAGASLARRNGLTWCGAARAQADDSDVAVELLLAAARAMAPVIRRFISLGLNRVWLDAGDTVYQCAPGPASGRCRALWAPGPAAGGGGLAERARGRTT